MKKNAKNDAKKVKFNIQFNLGLLYMKNWSILGLPDSQMLSGLYWVFIWVFTVNTYLYCRVLVFVVQR